MMKKISTLVISSLGLVALASGCAVDAVESEELLGTEEQEAVVCSNDQATNSIVAGMAVVAAREIGRWQAKTDLTKTSVLIQYSWGSMWSDVVALTQEAKNRCNARKAAGVPDVTTDCKTLQDLLNLQTSGSGVQFGGVTLTDPGVLRNRLVSYYDNQKNCYDDTARNGDNQPQNCPKESHELEMYWATTSGSTCAGGKDYHYKAKYAAGHPKAGQPLSGTDAAQLRNTLKWAGEMGNGGNEFLKFEANIDPNVEGDVKIDPDDNTTGGSGSGSGACEAAANPVWSNPLGMMKCDNTNIAKTVGTCCTCNGEQRVWKTAVQPGLFRCIP
jgi:hypothetical protein